MTAVANVKYEEVLKPTQAAKTDIDHDLSVENKAR